MTEYKQYVSFFEQGLRKLDFESRPNELYAPIKYILSHTGKRIRPVLTLMACDLFCQNMEKALPQSIAIELFHNFTLIHDDIMDDAPIRRGKETVYKKWNTNIAILSGDTLFALAYQFAQQADKEILGDILTIFNKTAIEVCEGQQFDMNYETQNNVRVEEYIEMIKLKTGVLFGASLKIGALIGGASEEDASKLYKFGLDIGLGFQLKDDLLDTFGDENIFGKKTGGDIITNKKTYLYLYAMEVADASIRSELFNLYNSTTIDPDEKIKTVKQLFLDLKVDKATNLEIDKYFERGMKYLDEVNVTEDKKSMLRDVARKMVDRER